MTTIVIGTANPGKVKEVERFLGDLPVVFRPMSEKELGLTIDEDANTYEENALIKAHAYVKATGLAVIASDSGLEIEALNNWPGLHSRRLDSDRRQTDKEVIATVQKKLADIPSEKRQYHFVVAYAFITPDGIEMVARAQHEGIMKEEMHSQEIPGFPMRRFWWVPKFNKYYNDLTEGEHGQINHNKLALEELRPVIETYLKESKESDLPPLSLGREGESSAFK